MRSLGRRTSVRTQSELAQTELSVPRWAQELRSAGPPEGPSPDPTTTTNKPPTDGLGGPGPGSGDRTSGETHVRDAAAAPALIAQ